MIVWQRIKNALWAILGLLAGFLLFGRKKDSSQIEEAKKTLSEVKKNTGEIVENKKRREHHAEELKEKLKKITTGTLILFLILIPIFCLPVRAEYYIPKNHDDAVETAIEYKELYEQAEADVDRLLEENRRLAEQLELMIQYNKRSRLGVTAGVIVVDHPGFYIGLTWSL